MMSSNVALLHSNNCCVLEPAICEDLDLHVVIFNILVLCNYKFFHYNRRDSGEILSHLFPSEKYCVENSQKGQGIITFKLTF